jgi:hypothetical protein
MSTPPQPPARYRIRIRGHLDPTWSAWFDSLAVVQADDGTTELAGPLADQSALFGLLARLRDPAAGRAPDGRSQIRSSSCSSSASPSPVSSAGQRERRA